MSSHYRRPTCRTRTRRPAQLGSYLFRDGRVPAHRSDLSLARAHKPYRMRQNQLSELEETPTERV